MPYFKVTLEGHNFPGDTLGKPNRRFGLFTTRWIIALNEKQAIAAAVASVWKDESIVLPKLKRSEDRPWLTTDSVTRVERLPRQRGTGAKWFEEGS